MSRPTSACSPESGDSTSPSKRAGTDASGRSSEIHTAPEFSSGGGRLFPVGGTSPDSTLLPTPNAGMHNVDEDPETWEARRRRLVAKGINGNGAGTPLGVAVRSISSSEDSRVSLSQRPVDDPLRLTSGGYGPSSPVWLAIFDPSRCSSRTCPICGQLVPESTSAGMGWIQTQASLFGDWHSARYSETWPSSGMTRRGRAYALPMSEHLTDARASFSSLPTPVANPENPGAGGELRAAISFGPDRRNETGVDSWGRPNGGRAGLLPTPAARDHKGGDLESREGGTSLPEEVHRMLPTPQAADAERKGADYARRTRPGSGGDDLSTVIRERSSGGRTHPRSEDGNES